MEINDQNIEWAVGKLSVFAGRLGSPVNADGWKAHGKALLRIVHNTPVAHKKLGKGQDVDLVLGLLFETTDRFPQPIEIRACYAKYFKPAVEIEVAGDD